MRENDRNIWHPGADGVLKGLPDCHIGRLAGQPLTAGLGRGQAAPRLGSWKFLHGADRLWRPLDLWLLDPGMGSSVTASKGPSGTRVRAEVTPEECGPATSMAQSEGRVGQSVSPQEGGLCFTKKTAHAGWDLTYPLRAGQDFGNLAVGHKAGGLGVGCGLEQEPA